MILETVGIDRELRALDWTANVVSVDGTEADGFNIIDRDAGWELATVPDFVAGDTATIEATMAP
jgi:hypothetical protein